MFSNLPIIICHSHETEWVDELVTRHLEKILLGCKIILGLREPVGSKELQKM